MRPVRILLISLLLLLGLPAAAAFVGGERFAERVVVQDQPLVLQGASLFQYKLLFVTYDIYAAALYLGDAAAPRRLLEDVPRRFEIAYLVGFEAGDFRKATLHGIEKNVGRERAEALLPATRAFNALYRDIAPGDRYTLTYLPGRGTELAKNGTPLGVVPGAEFSAALFSIWFGPEPFDEKLKADLLDPGE